MNKNTIKKNKIKKNSENHSKSKKKAPKKAEDKFQTIKNYMEQQHNNIHLLNNNIEQYQTLNAVRTTSNFNKSRKKFQRKSFNKDEKQRTLTKNNTLKRYKNINELLNSSSNASLNTKNNKTKKAHRSIEATSTNYHQINPKISSIKQRNNIAYNKNRINTKEINNNNNNIIINFFNAPPNKFNRDNYFNNFNNAYNNNLNNINTTSTNHYNGIYKEKSTKKNILNININSINNLNCKEYKTLVPIKNETYCNSNVTNNNNEQKNNNKNKKRCNTSENFISLNSFSSNNNNLRNNFKNPKIIYNNTNYNKTINISHRRVNINTSRKNPNFLSKNKSVKKTSKKKNNENSRDKYYMYYDKISEKNKIIKNNRFRNLLPQSKLIQNMIFDSKNKLKVLKHADSSMNKTNKNNNTINLKPKKNSVNISHSNTITNESSKNSNNTYNFLNKILKKRNHSNTNHNNIINYDNNNNNKNNTKKNNQQHFLSFNRFMKNELREDTTQNDESSKNKFSQKGYQNMKNSINASKNNISNKHFPIQRKSSTKIDNNINNYNKNTHNELPFNINRNFLDTNSNNQKNNISNLRNNKLPNYNAMTNNNSNSNSNNDTNINDNNNIKCLSNRFSHFNSGNNTKNAINKKNKNNKNENSNNNNGIKKNNNIVGIKVQNNTAIKIKPIQFKTNSDKIKKISQKNILPLENCELTIKINKNINPQYVEEYLDEILNNLFKEEKANIKELKFQMSSDFLNTHGINPETRTCLIDSLINLQKIFKFNERTLFITVQLFDKYIATSIMKNSKTIKEDNLDIILTASLLVASKLEESLIYKLSDYLGILSDNYTVNDLIQMEDELLGTIHFNIVSPTMLDFFEIFCSKLKLDKKLITQGLYLLNNILLDINLSQISGSVIAYSVVNIITKNNTGSLMKKINEINEKERDDDKDDEEENRCYFDAFFLLNNQDKINDLCYLIIVFSKGILKTEYINVFNKFNSEEFDFAAKFIED